MQKTARRQLQRRRSGGARAASGGSCSGGSAAAHRQRAEAAAAAETWRRTGSKRRQLQRRRRGQKTRTPRLVEPRAGDVPGEHGSCAQDSARLPGLVEPVRAVRRSASTPPVLVSCTTSLSPRGTLFPAACAESITGLLSANTHALASALYYPHTSQLRSTRYILPHAVRHLPCPSSSRARALLKYRPYNFLLEDPAKPNLFSS